MVIAVTTPAAVVVLFLFVDWRIGLVFVIAAGCCCGFARHGEGRRRRP
ncbi:MAG: hypothetical protein ACLT98_16675 [Eggerthellaceae bacterium]